MSTRHDYRRQAETYDETRRASPSLVRALMAALDGAPGRELLDVGGGTGNYSEALRVHGFAPIVVDVSPAMLAHAARKGLLTHIGDAAALPFRDASADAVILVSMLHHVREWRAALSEAARVLRAGGRLAAVVFTRENVELVGWLYDYFPSTRLSMHDQHPSAAELVAALPHCALTPFDFQDVRDASIGALQREPELVLQPRMRRQTSYFEQLAHSNPDEMAAGLVRLRADLDAGRTPDRNRAAARAIHGDAALLVWAKPH